MPIHIARQLSAKGQPNPADGEWPDFVAALRADVQSEYSAKTDMPAWVPARLNSARMQARLDAGEASGRASEVVDGSSIVGLDIDGAPAAAWAEMVSRLPHLSAVAHTSPSDDAAAPVRKGRVYVQLSREVPPDQIWPLRQALAQALGVREWLDGKTSDASRIFFAGRLRGTPDREFHSFGGEALEPAALLAAFPQAAPAAREPAAPRAGGSPLSFDPIAAIAELLSPQLEQKGNRHNAALAIGAALAKSGLGWSDAEIERVMRALPCDDPDGRVLDALGAAARARRGEPAGNWSSLAELGFPPNVVVAAEGVANLNANRLAQKAAGYVERAVAGDADAWGEVVTIGDNLYEPIPEVRYIYERLAIAPGPPSLWAGYGGLGKTLCVQGLVICAAAGLPFLGALVRRCRVLHLDHEQGKRVTTGRYKRLAVALGVTPADLRGQLDIVPFPRVNLTTPGIEDALLRRVAGYDLVIIDSLRAATPGMNENESDIRAPLDMLARISEQTGVTFIVIHHARKPGDGGRRGSANQEMRGNSAINDAAQTVIMLEPPPLMADGETYVYNGFRVLCGKVRDGKRFEGFGVVVEDTAPKADVAPFPGLRLSLADVPQKVELATNERTVLLRAAIRNVFATTFGDVRGGIAAMCTRLQHTGATRNEIRAECQRMLDQKEIIEASNKAWTLAASREP